MFQPLFYNDSKESPDAITETLSPLGMLAGTIWKLRELLCEGGVIFWMFLFTNQLLPFAVRSEIPQCACMCI